MLDTRSMALCSCTGGYARVPAQAHGTYRSSPPLPWPSRGCRLGSSFPQLAAACLSLRMLPLQHRQLAADGKGGEGVSTRSRAPAGAPRLAPAAAATGGSAQRPRAVPLSPAAAGTGRTGTAGEEALPVPREIYHLSLSCRSACSSLCPLRLRATCLRMHVTTSRRARCVHGERLLQQQGQSLSGPSALTLLPLPSPSPTHTQSHLRHEDF